MMQLTRNRDQASSGTSAFNRRRFERFALPVAYTTITVQRSEPGVVTLLTGHVYDISESGVRFELDEPLTECEVVSASIMLPCERDAVIVSGRVVWLNDTFDDPGPRRMALDFIEFASMNDRARLIRCLSTGRLARAA